MTKDLLEALQAPTLPLDLPTDHTKPRPHEPTAGGENSSHKCHH